MGNSGLGVNTMTTPSDKSNAPNLNGFAPSDLHALQIALQQQQQNLQQQLQNFILLQQPTNVQASAIFLQTQISQAVAQATSQLRLLQHRQHQDPETPKSKSIDIKAFQHQPLKMTTTSSSSPLVTSVTRPHSITTSNDFNGKSDLLRPLYNLPSAPKESPTSLPFPTVPRLDLPADENVDLEELEQFAKEFKQRRIKLGND